MNREEILNKSREENKKGDERELHIQAKAGNIAFRFGGVACMLILLVERLMYDSLALSMPILALYCLMASVSQLYSGIKLRAGITIAFGVALGLAAVMAFCMYIGVLPI